MEGGEESLGIYMSSLKWPRLILVQMALRAAIELKVFDIMSSSGPNAKLSAHEIVSKLPIITKNHPNAASSASGLDRILRLLSVNSILSSSSRTSSSNQIETVYALTPESRLLVCHKQGETSFSASVLLTSEKESVDCLYGLKDAVLEPNRSLPLYKAYHGVSVFEHNSEKPRLNKLFNDAMGDYSNTYMDKILKAYDGFRGLDEVMDVGGGSGKAIQKIVAMYPTLRGINLDVPHVIADAPNHLGIENVIGDMFKPLPKAQNIMLKNVLHNWSDDECVKILENCWEALPENGGKVIVAENIIPQQLGNNVDSNEVISLDVTMMLYFGGKVRTKYEFDNLATRAGFYETMMFPVGGGFHVMEFIKKTKSQ